MKHTKTRALYDYWDALRLSRPAPLRSEVDPRDIKNLLTGMFILHRLSDDNFAFRLAGTGLCRLFGREMRDENFLSIWQRHEVSSLRSLFHSVTEDQTAAVIGATATYKDGSRELLEYLFLPVRLDATNEVRIMGSCTAVDPAPNRPPMTIVKQEVASLRLLWPGKSARFMETTVPGTPPAVTDTQVPPPHDAAEQRGHLWVIEGGVS